MQEDHEKVLKALEVEINESVALRTKVRGLEVGLKAKKEEMAKLKESHVHSSLPRPLSPIREDIPKFTQQTQHPMQASRSLGVEEKITKKTYYWVSGHVVGRSCINPTRPFIGNIDE